MRKVKNSKHSHSLGLDCTPTKTGDCTTELEITWRELYQFIYYKVQNREEAEDITQETYVKVLDYIQREDVAVDKYNSFLKTIALNIIRDNWRKEKRQGNSMNLDAINSEEMAVSDFSDSTANHVMIENALESLNKEQQTVIQLRIINGYSTSETAKIMNKKEGTIRVLQYRALQALAEIMKKSER